MENCVIVSYGRSAIAKANKGSLAKVSPVDFGAEVLKGVLDKVPSIKDSEIDDVIIGCAIPEGKMGLNPARNIVLRAGLSYNVSAQTVNRFCSSGIQTMAIGAAMIMSGMQDIVVAGGVESMTCPVISDDSIYLNEWLLDNTDAYVPMGITAENVADKYDMSRDRMEDLAVLSNERAAKAVELGYFEKEIIPVKGFNKEGKEIIFSKDECYRKGTNKETLKALKTCFKEDGKVTAATSSQRSDGAAFVVMMSESKSKEKGLKPIAKFVSFAVEGVDPAYMGIGPIKAVKKVMEKADIFIDQLDVIEINEAFASQALVCIDELGFDMNKVNPRGGALALGHPLGATGAILSCKVMSYLQENGGKYGLITMCIGGGMGAAAIIEMCN